VTQTFRLVHGDALESLRALDDQSVDSIVTDPPYGLGKEPDALAMLRDWLDTGHHDVKGKGFMGKEWDAFVPQPAVWKECLRVLKPGGHLLAFAGTRTQDLMGLGLRIAGFEVRDCIGWMYGCLSDDTEVLTRNGWELYHTATDKEILAYDTEADIYQWETPSRWSEYRVESDTAYRIESDSTDQIVSRNHRCLVERDGRLAFVAAEKCDSMERVPYLQGDFSALPQGCGKLLFSGVLREGEGLAEAALSKRQGEEAAWEGIGWGEESSMERRPYLLQEEGEVREPVNQVRSVSVGVYSDGSQGRVCDGASTDCSDGVGQVAPASRVCSPCQSRRDRQSAGQSDVVCVECGPQTVRARTSYRTTLATVTPIEYSGIVFCPTVSTGAFVARRSGKVFVTGNSGFPKSLDVSKAIDKAAGVEREFRPIGNPIKRMIPGADQNENGSWIKDNGLEFQPGASEPATDDAKQWAGFGTSLKPAYEPIIVARKPLIGTVAANVLKHGTGAINVDGCRVPTSDNLNGGAYAECGGRAESQSLHGGSGMNVAGKTAGVPFVQPIGRFPANIIHDGSEEVLAVFPDSGGRGKARKLNRGTRDDGWGMADSPGDLRDAGSGSASRFFYCAKAKKSERRDSKHPTIKPLALMQYLVRLVTPPGGTLLDPYMGSGTTIEAAKLEGFSAIGIDNSEESVADTKARIKN
jgi:site-specific DNA-methyltransferase (adenine-specific)